MRVASRRAGLTGFWRWWMGQLAPLMPARLRIAVQRRRLRPVLTFEADAAVLWAPAVANGHLAYQEAARIALSADEAATAAAGSAAIEALSPAERGGGAGSPQVVIALPASQVLRKTIAFPQAVEDNLAQVLTYDLDRHTPFKADEVYFDASIVARDPVKKEIRVDWAAALRSVVDQARRRAERWGATVVAVTPELPTRAARPVGSALNLLPAAERPEIASWRRWEVWLPLALIAALALVATALPLWQKRGSAIALMELAGQARAKADASSALRDQLERLTGDYNFALQKKYGFPSALQSVDEVTKLLPDDTWLTQLEMKSAAKGKDPHREILLRGESANAGRLVSLFEASKLFEQAAPRSPTTKIQPGPGEIFDLGVQVKPLPPPPPVRLEVAARAAPPPVAPGAAPPPATPTAPAAPTAAAPPPGTPATRTPSGSSPAARIPAGPPPGPPARLPGVPPTGASEAADLPEDTVPAQPGEPAGGPPAPPPAAS